MQDLYVDAVHRHAKKGAYHSVLSRIDENIGYAVFAELFHGDIYINDVFTIDDNGHVTNIRVTDCKLLAELKNLIENM